MAQGKRDQAENKSRSEETQTGAEPEARADEQNENTATDFPIVGIGASAGGLAAFKAFFSGMPSDTEPGMAFVLVQHLAPDHESILSDLIRRYTRMQVQEVEDGMQVQRNCAYIIPPNHDMAFIDGALQLMEPSAPRGQRMPIDFFFRSLAQDQHERAIGVILSGTGSDGTLGLRTIKGQGGMVMVQDPESAEHNGMPRSAIATGLVDYALPAEEMPTQLIAYVSHAFGRSSQPLPKPSRDENMLKKIFVILRNQTGHDFSQYKTNTVNRRVQHRMSIQQIKSMDKYARYLKQTPEEAEMLFRDLLIGVTSFFRDPEAFEVLEEKVIPRLFANRQEEGTIRVWCPGCSTGEEAYSLAILIAEHQKQLQQNFKVQIFATDIDSQAIAAARQGLFPVSIAADIAPKRLSRFFTSVHNDDIYRIQKRIREMLIFSEQNVIEDPPFSRLDLISCRNLLIYMNRKLQKKIVSLFHYALNPDGFLFLGASETLGESAALFSPVNSKWKIYQRKENAQSAQFATNGNFLPTMTTVNTAQLSLETKTASAEQTELTLRELTEQTLLQQFTPSAALVNSHGEILYIHGRTGLYLEPAPGRGGVSNILKMAREGLRSALTRALHTAATEQKTVFYPDLQVKSNSDVTAVNLTVRPIKTNSNPEHEATLYLIVLKQLPSSEQASAEQAAALSACEQEKDYGEEAEKRIAELRRKLQAKEESLQTTFEELQTSNEELRSSNEELQSMNEELQSTNEELETSKEELQSLNEELKTVNSELETKVVDLTQANNDMNNLLAGTGIGTVFVDLELRILRFTPSATEFINLLQSDIGRPVGHIVSNLKNYDNLVEDTQEVLDTLVPKEAEVQTLAGNWYAMRIQPYRTVENVIEGAVLTFIDISERKQMQEELCAAHARLSETLVAVAREPLLVLDTDLRVISASSAFYDTFQVTADTARGQRLWALKNNQWDMPALRRLLREVVEQGTTIRDHQLLYEFEDCGQCTLRINAHRAAGESGASGLILLAVEKVTGDD